jgi:putative hydrolase of the HAD superfamily
MAALCGLSVEAFTREYFRRRLELDRGSLDAAAYWTWMLAHGGVRATPELIGRLSEEDVRSWSRTDSRMLGWAGELRAAGIRTAILSNMPGDMVAFLAREAAWLSGFEARVFSADVSLVKPEEGIYRICLQRLALPPAQALFMDDVPRNVEGARRIGMEAFLHESAEATARAAAAYGLPVASLG